MVTSTAGSTTSCSRRRGVSRCAAGTRTRRWSASRSRGRSRAFDFHHLAVEGDIVFADWTIAVERRHDAKVIEWRGMSVAELRDGRIVWWREYYDDPQALATAARG